MGCGSARRGASSCLQPGACVGGQGQQGMEWMPACHRLTLVSKRKALLMSNINAKKVPAIRLDANTVGVLMLTPTGQLPSHPHCPMPSGDADVFLQGPQLPKALVDKHTLCWSLNPGPCSGWASNPPLSYITSPLFYLKRKKKKGAGETMCSDTCL